MSETQEREATSLCGVQGIYIQGDWGSIIVELRGGKARGRERLTEIASHGELEHLEGGRKR